MAPSERQLYRQPALIDPFTAVRAGSIGETASLARRGALEIDLRHVAPQILERIEAARLGREDVQDDVEIVGDDPVAVALAVGGARKQLLALHAEMDLVRDRLGLARVATGADDEVVGEDADRAHVENDDVFGQLFGRQGGDAARFFEWSQRDTSVPCCFSPSVARRRAGGAGGVMAGKLCRQPEGQRVMNPPGSTEKPRSERGSAFDGCRRRTVALEHGYQKV